MTELFPYEPAAVNRILVVSLVDVDPSGPYDLPLVLQGLMPWDFVVHSLVPNVSHLFTSGLHDLPSVELHACEIIPGQGGRNVSSLVLMLGQSAKAEIFITPRLSLRSGSGTRGVDLRVV